jgi:hypothetical protein
LPDCKSQPGEVSDTDGGDAADQGRGGRREITGPALRRNPERISVRFLLKKSAAA